MGSPPDSLRPLRDSLKSSLVIGLLGSVLLGLWDVAAASRAHAIKFFCLMDLLDGTVYPLLLYAVFGAISLTVSWLLVFTVGWLGGTRWDKAGIPACQIGLFVVIAIPLALEQKLNLITSLSIQDMALICVLSLGCGTGAGFAAYLLLKRYRPRKVFLCSCLAAAGLLGAFVWATVSPCPFPWPKESKNASTALDNAHNAPNILWIVMDTTRADHLSCYGYSRNTTPRIDAIAREGVRYSNCISVAPWTIPSHASMLTGLFPSQHKAQGAWRWLGNEFKTLPEILSENGYHTAAISTNGFFSPAANMDKGFETFVYFNGKPLWMLNCTHLARNMRSALAVRSKPLARLAALLECSLNNDAGAKAINRLAEKYIKRSSQTLSPFFLFINYMEAHDPYGDTPRGGDYLREIKIARADAFIRSAGMYETFFPYAATKQQFSHEDERILNALYDGDLAYLDGKIGELVEYIRDLGILDDTMLIITADHGENLGQYNLLFHMYDIHRSLVHVPLIIRYPKRFAGGARVDTPVQNIDLFSTVLDIAGNGPRLQHPPTSRSLLSKQRPSLALSEADFSDMHGSLPSFFDRYPDVDQRIFHGVWRSMEMDGYAYIVDPRRALLYDLRKDPFETYNCLGDYPQRAKQLEEQLMQAFSRIEEGHGT